MSNPPTDWIEREKRYFQACYDKAYEAAEYYSDDPAERHYVAERAAWDGVKGAKKNGYPTGW